MAVRVKPVMAVTPPTPGSRSVRRGRRWKRNTVAALRRVTAARIRDELVVLNAPAASNGRRAARNGVSTSERRSGAVLRRAPEEIVPGGRRIGIATYEAL